MEPLVYSDAFRINEMSTQSDCDTKRSDFKENTKIFAPIFAPAPLFEKKKRKSQGFCTVRLGRPVRADRACISANIRILGTICYNAF